MNPHRSSPLGAAVCTAGVNFSVYSRHASGIELLLFDWEDELGPRASSASTLGPIAPHDHSVNGSLLQSSFGFTHGNFSPELVSRIAFDPFD